MSEILINANAARHYQIKHSDLPLCCPMPNMTVWNSHPRVYLPIEATGKAQCPYCSATFELIDFAEYHEKK